MEKLFSSGSMDIVILIIRFTKSFSIFSSILNMGVEHFLIVTLNIVGLS